MKKVIEIVNGTARHPLYRMKSPINFTLTEGEHIAIVGNNGAGKSILADTIVGKYPLLLNETKYDFGESDSPLAADNIKYITFRDSYGDSDANYYYQQRWNSQDMETTPLVKELIPEIENERYRNWVYELFGVSEFLNKHVILLSSGELRKLQLTKALLTKPKVLILDNPFIGLDSPTRDYLKNLLTELTLQAKLQVILILSKDDEIPQFITHVVPVRDMICGEKISREQYLKQEKDTPKKVLSDTKRESILNLPAESEACSSEEIVFLNNVSIRYGERTILKNLNWKIRKGEMWALTGENGSGKSTLLSLICADNPQSYACDISIFGQKRGQGVSIWDIKKRIGYLSPEMHRAYLRKIPTIDIVASGLRDSIGLYKRPNDEEKKKCAFWMEIFGISNLSDRCFLQLSSGEQRLALLTRAFVKDPELLILDEPFHGLDTKNRQLVKDIIEAFCSRKDKTMIMVSHYEDDFPSLITDKLYLKKER
jgi:molybdate transport system ATP-binding protein